MKLSIVIVNYNTNQLIIEAIDSIKSETQSEFEIIVVDNASKREDPIKIVKNHPEVKLIRNEDNDGFGAANNIGISHAQGEYVLLLNSDTIILDSALDKCIDFMDSQKSKEANIGLLGCKLLNGDRTDQTSTFGEFRLGSWLISSNAFLRRLVASKKPEETGSRYVGAVSGAFMLFRKSVLSELSGKWFDPDIFMYSEETEFCRSRVSKLCRIYYWTGAEVVHFGSGSSTSSTEKQELLSYSLTWYKRGWVMYLLYIFWTAIINLPTDLVIALLSRGERRKIFIRKVINYILIVPLLVFSIPRYSYQWGSRKTSLKVL